jgi:imidazolonepropionase-like amidohydrolase
VPTLSPGIKLPAQMEDNPFFTDAIKAKAYAASAAAASNFADAQKAGVKIAFGTDSAVTPHGENADEFVMMVEAGMDPMDALHAATVAAADLLGQSDSLGTIAAGKLADIVAVNGNPLDNIAVMRDVAMVMKAGKQYR